MSLTMRTPGEVMAENPPSQMSGRSSPLRLSSPAPERKGINRAQLTLQELQDLAERQRQQILYNSKELMEKQQQLMRMHQDFRTRLKLQGESPRTPRLSSSNGEPMSPSLMKAPRSPVGKREQDQYAKMLRQTYQSMGKMQKRNNLQNEIDVRKFNNVELVHELEKVRSIFSSKQNELAEAVRKVDVLTHELDQRKNGENGSVPTPERINRRKKIQAAKDELDRLRNELIVRNEMNSQQSHQLQLQRDIIHEKQQELRQLNSRMNELGNALKVKKGGRIENQRKSPNQALFNGTYLQDTLSRRRSNSGRKVVHDVNANDITENEPIKDDVMNGLANHNELQQSQSIFHKTPLSANQIWRKEQNNLSNTHDKTSSHSPSSSISSLSSLSSSSMTPDDVSKPFSFTKDATPPPPPPRSTPVGVLIDNRPVKVADDEYLANLRNQKQKINDSQMEKFDVEATTYTDSSLSRATDNIAKYENYGDAMNSCTLETITKSSVKQPPPVATKPKPAVAPKPSQLAENNDVIVVPTSGQVSNVDQESSNDGNQATWPAVPDLAENVPSEPDDFELSFADIDELNDLQVEEWSTSGSSISQNSFDSDGENIDEAVVPVVISISPDKMPPPILMKPDKPRKPKRRVVLDPFALLLDAALEGELENVKKILQEVPDPSKPNPEGITALHNAVCGNHKGVVKYLVEVACDINSADNNGWTPLHCAAFYNDTQLCSFLVEHGASVFATTYTDYQTPAHKCSQLDENYDECFTYLHECKENAGRINNGLVHALYDYTGENDDELSFFCGDEITILRRGDAQEKEWWWARDQQGNTGYIPCNLIGNFPRIAAVV